MNAGGVDKACKSYALHQFALQAGGGSGERVSNTWVMNPKDGHNSANAELIPDSPPTTKVVGGKSGFLGARFGISPRPIS